jgi:mevalonate kinase
MKRLNAKIILLGEYSLIIGSSALTVPFKKYYGSFSFSDNLTGSSLDSNQILKFILEFFRLQNEYFLDKIDLELFQQDTERGLFFNSTIPVGYGLGSSGALVAAVFKDYSVLKRMKNDNSQLTFLQKDMGLAESFFHGTSSGLDPLSCYIGKPLLVNKNSITIMNKKKFQKLLSNFYLFDTGIISTTKSLVNFFIDRMKEDFFRDKVKDLLISSVNCGIQSLLDGDKNALKSCVKNISDLQFTYFKEAIPDHIKEFWQYGLETGDYYFKLCGSGGGGFMLVYSELGKDMLEKKIKKDLLPLF